MSYRSHWRNLGRNYGYLLPGMPLAVVSLSLLLPLLTLSISTLIVWVGVVILPATLILGSTFASLSRARAERWGEAIPAPVYQPAGAGIRRATTIILDPRRWLDLFFETFIALPLRLTTFVISITWSAIGLGGLTYGLWSWFVPGDSGWISLLKLTSPSAVPGTVAGQNALDIGINFLLGAVFTLALPTVLHALTQFDLLLTSVLLGAPPAGDAESKTPVTPAAIQRPTFSADAWIWLAVTFVSLILLAVSWPVTAVVYSVHPALAMVLALAQAAGPVLAVRWAGPGLLVTAVSALGMMLTTMDGATTAPWPWPVTALLTYYLLVVVLGLRYAWFWSAAAWLTGTALSLFGPLLAGASFATNPGNRVVLVAISGGLAIIGPLIQVWVRGLHRVEEAENISAEEAQRRRELEERNRIARDVHDVVAHAMSVINVQATTAKYRTAGVNDAVQGEFDEIAASSRQALTEMRSLLAILRNDDAGETAPAPKLADIADLIAATRASGAEIDFVHDPASLPANVPATTQLTAYRVIQEGLSNALRHAPGSKIQVRVAVQNSDGQLLVEVANSAAKKDHQSAPGSGLGLAGVRERVAALGGTVDAVELPDGGFLLSVALLIPTEQGPKE